MAKKQNDRMLWPLPASDGPFPYIPVCIPIPDDPQHRQNFLGAILALSRWFNYERTGDTRGKTAADAWLFSFDKVIDTVNGVNPCCGDSGVIYRRNGDLLEQSTDGGTSWYTVPDGDTYWPPDDAPLLPPLPGDNGDTKKCQAAWNAARVYQAFHITLAPYFVLGAIAALAISAVGAGFSFLLGAGPLGYAAVSSIVTSALLVVGGGLVADDFSEEVVSDLMCILVGHFAADGTMSEAAFTAMLADVSAESGLIWDAIYIYIEGMGLAGMNNASRSQNTAEPDCGDCQPEYMRWLNGYGNTGLAPYLVGLNNPTYNAVDDRLEGNCIDPDGPLQDGIFNRWYITIPEPFDRLEINTHAVANRNTSLDGISFISPGGTTLVSTNGWTTSVATDPPGGWSSAQFGSALPAGTYRIMYFRGTTNCTVDKHAWIQDIRARRA